MNNTSFLELTSNKTTSEMSNEKLNRKKRPLKKCPEAPKRFKSPYIWFVSEKLEEIKNDAQFSSENKATDVMKILAIIWKNLTPMEKLVYEIKAQEDKQRYSKEISGYEGPSHVPNKRVRKESKAPKRHMSAFLIYCQEFRSVLRKEHPSLKNTELSTLLANQWKALSEDEKKPYIEEELQGRELYHIQMKEYKKMKESYKLESNEGMAEIKEEEDKETVELIEIAEEVEAEKTQESEEKQLNIDYRNFIDQILTKDTIDHSHTITIYNNPISFDSLSSNSVTSNPLNTTFHTISPNVIQPKNNFCVSEAPLINSSNFQIQERNDQFENCGYFQNNSNMHSISLDTLDLLNFSSIKEGNYSIDDFLLSCFDPINNIL